MNKTKLILVSTIALAISGALHAQDSGEALSLSARGDIDAPTGTTTTIWDEAIDGDLGVRTAPTSVMLGSISDRVTGNVGGAQPEFEDCFNFDVPADSSVFSVTLENYVPSGGNVTSGFNLYTGVTANPGAFGDLVSVAVSTANIGQDIMTGNGGGPLTEGNYTICMLEGTPNQGYALVLGSDIDPTGEGPARFEVTKDFDDNNTAEVDVEISCNTGLPLTQPSSISEGDGVTFVVTDFNTGELTCSVTESVPAGYVASYSADGGPPSADGCVFADVDGGAFHTCEITNNIQAVDVEVSKVWLDSKPEFNPVNYAEAEYSCSNVSSVCNVEGGCGEDGNLEFVGNPGDDSFSVYPNWDGSTTCTVTEVDIADGNVETDDSECNSLSVLPGSGASCTIYNTRLYAGIPTLSQYGLGIMVLLMLGFGLVGFRRFA